MDLDFAAMPRTRESFLGLAESVNEDGGVLAGQRAGADDYGGPSSSFFDESSRVESSCMNRGVKVKEPLFLQST